jgi:hypothetical protein
MSDEFERFRVLLCRLGDSVRDAVVGRRGTVAEMAEVAHESAADTIYAIDKLSEEAISRWFLVNWPSSEPVEVVMEGIDDAEPLCFPVGVDVLDTRWKCILDPIDGTRGLMYDKRSAWSLAGLAPQLGVTTQLSDLCVACMTELPTTKQWRADQVSAVRGRGLVSEAVNVLDGTRVPVVLRPSGAKQFEHGFASLAKYFPEGRTLTAQIEELMWDKIIGSGKHDSPTIFDDQYICTGGQFYELLAGHDRMVGDIRPLVFQCLDLESSLVCHPYDAAAWLLLEEGGVIYESPLGGFPDAPLDTTSAVMWVAFANRDLAEIARPVLHETLAKLLS